MEKIERDAIKKMFKKVKHFRLDLEYESVDWTKLFYYGWVDATDDVMYTVYEYNGELQGIRWEVVRNSNASLKLGMCEICRQHKPLGEIVMVSAKTKHLPKGVDYRTRGNYICLNSRDCNEKITELTGIDKLYSSILEG